MNNTNETPVGLESYTIPASTWAIFSCQNENPQQIQNIQERRVLEWLSSSDYEFADAPDIEVYDDKGNVELWLPIRKRKPSDIATGT